MMKKAPQRSAADPEFPGVKLKSFLDTSVTIKQLTGHSKHKAYLSSAVPQPRYVNNYVRMEFYRALLIFWVHLYFEAIHPFHRSFSDALAFCSDSFGRGPKSYLNAIANILAREGLAAGSPVEKELCLRKLEDVIFAVAFEFERAYEKTGEDPTECARTRSPLRLSRVQDRRSTLIEFEETFSDTDGCRRRCAIGKFFQGGKYAGPLLTVAQVAKDDGAHPALKKMGAPIQKGNEDTATVTCSACGRMGDAIIAISMPEGWKLHSLDTVHEPICQVLGKEFQLHPSIARLKKQDLGDV
jgi:hypothetical protein